MGPVSAEQIEGSPTIIVVVIIDRGGRPFGTEIGVGGRGVVHDGVAELQR